MDYDLTGKTIVNKWHGVTVFIHLIFRRI